MAAARLTPAVGVVAAVLLGVSAVGACSGSTPTPAAATTVVTPTPSAGAAAHCTASKGVVVSMQSEYGTNLPRDRWVPLGDPVDVCRFESAGDRSRIYVDLDTLASTRPTLAALAYLSKPQTPSAAGGANPSSALCVKLGGAVGYGPGVNGGGLVAADGSDDAFVVNPCTFVDGSFIDAWGIAYYGNGTVRGADLAPLFRFDRSTAPRIFPSS